MFAIEDKVLIEGPEDDLLSSLEFFINFPVKSLIVLIDLIPGVLFEEPKKFFLQKVGANNLWHRLTLSHSESQNPGVNAQPWVFLQVVIWVEFYIQKHLLFLNYADSMNVSIDCIVLIALPDVPKE